MTILTQRFGELIRKLWNPRNFKAHVSPHEMLQAVVLCSRKRFQITQQGKAQGVGLGWKLDEYLDPEVQETLKPSQLEGPCQSSQDVTGSGAV